jgi:hypothetical protein
MKETIVKKYVQSCCNCVSGKYDIILKTQCCINVVRNTQLKKSNLYTDLRNHCNFYEPIIK